METLSNGYTWVAVALAVMAYSSFTKSYDLAKTLVISLLALCVVDLISFRLVKPLVGRERPCWELKEVKMPLGSCGGSYGFTSNHATNSAAVAVYWSRRYPQWRRVALILAGLIGFSRIYLGVHYPFDIIFGWLLGGAVGFLFTRFKWAQ